MTIAASMFEAHLTTAFPQLTYGRYNRRLIAGSTSWSQHSWPGGNARDIYIRYDDVITASEMQFLDKVYAYILKNKTRLNVRYALWRVKGHYNHIHVDFWPKGYGTPPPSVERYQFSNGRVVVGDPGPIYLPTPPPPPGYFEGMEEDMKELILNIQKALNAAAQRDSQGRPLVEDGIWGANTAYALAEAFKQVRPKGATFIY